MKNRDIDIDKIRALACYIVIAVHIDNLGVGVSIDKSKALYSVLFGDGVALFFMLTGCFLFSNPSFTKVLKKTFLKIVLPAFVVMVISYALFPWINNEINLIGCVRLLHVDWQELLSNILNWRTGEYRCEHLWYVFSYVQVILLFPLLKPLCSKKEHWKYIAYIVGLDLAGFLLLDIKVFVNLDLTPYFILSASVVYILLGYLIYQYKDLIRNNKIVRLASGLTLVVVEIVRWILQLRLYAVDFTNKHYLFWNTGMAMIFSASLFLFLYSFQLKNKALKVIVTQIADASLYIYLVHYAIILFLDQRGFPSWVLHKIGADSLEITNNAAEFAYLAIRIVVVLLLSYLFSIFIMSVKRLVKFGAGRLKRGRNCECA